MRILLATIILHFSLCTSCSEPAVEAQAPVLVENYKIGPESRRTLKLEIEGMMCEEVAQQKSRKNF